MPQCERIKDDGMQCNGRAVSGSRFCYFHDPDNKDGQMEARQKGGRNRLKPVIPSTLPENTPDFAIESARDVVQLLAQTINQVRRGEIDPKVSNAIGYLAGVMLRAREQGELDERLTELEQAFSKGGRHVGGYRTSA